MPRKHIFMIVVLLAAALVAGALALTRTPPLGSSAGAATGSDIAFRLKELNRQEAALKRQLAERGGPGSARQITVFRRASAYPVSSAHEHEDAYESGVSEDAGRDD